MRSVVEVSEVRFVRGIEAEGEICLTIAPSESRPQNEFDVFEFGTIL